MSEKQSTPDLKPRVRIHIDQKVHHSPDPSPADELYSLGEVKADLILYREVHGDREDELVPRGHELVHLHEDEHFHSGPPKGVTIIVVGTPHEWLLPAITYTEVVTLFDPTYPQHPETTYSVTYKKGLHHKPDGILSPGASVKVREGMEFNVSSTGQS